MRQRRMINNNIYICILKYNNFCKNSISIIPYCYIYNYSIQFINIFSLSFTKERPGKKDKRMMTSISDKVIAVSRVWARTNTSAIDSQGAPLVIQISAWDGIIAVYYVKRDLWLSPVI